MDTLTLRVTEAVAQVKSDLASLHPSQLFALDIESKAQALQFSLGADYDAALNFLMTRVVKEQMQREVAPVEVTPVPEAAKSTGRHKTPIRNRLDVFASIDTPVGAAMTIQHGEYTSPPALATMIAKLGGGTVGWVKRKNYGNGKVRLKKLRQPTADLDFALAA